MQDKFYRNLNDFVKLFKIGGGQFGEIYKIKEKKGDQTYAAKILLQKITSESYNLEIFREVNNLSKICHPSIIELKGYSERDFDNNPFPVIITEYVPHALNKILDAEKRGLSDINGIIQKN